jgi:uncharacterized repeat protein (TIGR04076 family)
MPYDLSTCRITVLKRTVDHDLANEYLDDPDDFGPCTRYHDGQEFVLENPFAIPEGLCPWAWANMRQDILTLASGGNFPWINRPGTAIAGCPDYLRPVIFRVERVA